MKAIQTLMSHLTDPSAILDHTKALLRELDPEYPAEETAFQTGLQALRHQAGGEHTACIDDLVAAQDQRLAGGLVFLAWLGLELNISCFRNPVNKLFLNADYEDIHQEAQMNSLPTVRAARERFDAACRQLPPELLPLLEPVLSFYRYLETTAYKLAHYLGFRLGDELLYLLIPGYCHDGKITCAYHMELSQYLSMAVPE